MTALEIIFVYTLGALGYGGLELLWRGWTHWTMLLLGGLCFLVIYGITVLLRLRLWEKWLLCALSVTTLEFLTGCLLNLYLGWAVWDYRSVPGNLLGQICPLYAAYWFLLSIPCSGLAHALRVRLFRRAGAPGELP